jgi:protein-S-isoprenylcysteine O-methyltransferase Ste14
VLLAIFKIATCLRQLSSQFACRQALIVIGFDNQVNGMGSGGSTCRRAGLNLTCADPTLLASRRRTITAMTLMLWIALAAFWGVWLYPFVFRAPHRQKRASITARGATLLGLLLECIAIAMANWIQLSEAIPRSPLRIAVFFVTGLLAAILSWSAVAHLGRQFRITAGLYQDHELVTTGPYSVVRHPIYSSLLAILICTQAILTPLRWAAVSLVLFIVGTEIRVHAEDGLLASRFGESFHRYKKSVSAYIPFVR